MSGFEVAGIVLAVLPFFIETYKAYGHQTTALQKAVTPTARNKDLQDFYEEFYWDTYELRKNIEKIVLMLPTLSDERKDEVIQSRDLDNWDQAQDVAAALQGFLSSDDYDAFQMVMGKVLELLARLIKDETVHISKSETVSACHINEHRPNLVHICPSGINIVTLGPPEDVGKAQESEERHCGQQNVQQPLGTLQVPQRETSWDVSKESRKVE